MCLDEMKNRALVALVLASVMTLGASGCSDPAGEACSTDGDCQPGYECVSTGGVMFGDSICLLAEQGGADVATDVVDSGASDTAADVARDVDDARDGDAQQDVGDQQDVDVQQDVEGDAAGDVDAADVVVDPCGDFDVAACAPRDNAEATGCVEGDCTYECADGFSDQNGDLAQADGDGCESAECIESNGGQETCDGADNDCDGEVDEGVKTTYYLDSDGDGYGTSTARDLCSATGDYRATQGGDCDDADDGTYPTANEVCDGADNDCDGSTDEGVTTTYYMDGDGDGYGVTGDTSQSCGPIGDYSATQGDDCNDGNNNVHPGATEQCNSIIDYDCDGDTMCADTECAGKRCLTPGGSGFCSGGVCQTFGGIDECRDDGDCLGTDWCQNCAEGNVCCPQGQLCICPQPR